MPGTKTGKTDSGIAMPGESSSSDHDSEKEPLAEQMKLVIPETDDERETWGTKVDFLLSVIGFAVDLGNIVRFPYVCFENGGGLGFGICVISSYVAMYYNTIIAWGLYYLVMSFRSEVPWHGCDNNWNTGDCVMSGTSGTNNTATANRTFSSDAKEYFFNNVLEVNKSTGLGDIGGIKWEIALCLFFVFFIVYFALWKGIKSSGKAVWITATFPYIVLIILLIRGVTLEGSWVGIRYYLEPNLEKLKEPKVWMAAASQIFFSLGPGFGVLLALASYGKFHNNCYKDALLTASVNCCTSFIAGFVVFSTLGYMAHSRNITIEAIAEEAKGPAIVFVAYPEAIGTMGFSVFFAIIFFMMLITLGIDSTALITGICDEWPKIGRHRELFVLGLMVYCFLGALSTTTYGGAYVVALLDAYGAPMAILFFCFIEAIAVNWFYGVRRFSSDIEQMIGFRPGYFWQICWAFISPLFLLALFIVTVTELMGGDMPMTYNMEALPEWARPIGILMVCSSVLCIPAYMLYKFIVSEGTICQRWTTMIEPEEDTSRMVPVTYPVIINEKDELL